MENLPRSNEATIQVIKGQAAHSPYPIIFPAARADIPREIIHRNKKIEEGRSSKMSNRLKTKLYILADKIHRKNDRGSFYISVAYVQEEKSVKHVSFPQVKHLESTLEKGKYYLCTNVGTIGDTVRLTDSSKVHILLT